MTTSLIILLVLAVFAAAIWRRSPREGITDGFVPKDLPDNLSQPIISYTLYVLDTRNGRRLQMYAPEEFSNQFGILQGQLVELHWNVLNADWISIDGVGYVQAIGVKEFYPEKNTRYKIMARNRNFSTEQEFFVRVFPVPVMEKLSVPMPEISLTNISLFSSPVPSIGKPIAKNFPNLNIPSVIEISKENFKVKPQVLPLQKINKSPLGDLGVKSFKTKLFDRLEDAFNENYKVRDILQTIRKHYE